MEKHLTMPPSRPPTQAAEGLPRWRWTVAELGRIAAAGFFTEYDDFELLGGEMVPMPPEGRRLVMVRGRLTLLLYELTASRRVMVISKPQFNLAGDTYAKPDILVHPMAIETYDVRGSDALLVVEIADASLAYDLKTKMPLYAAHGVPEYWVVNAATLMTTVHRQPSGAGYAFIREVPPDVPLTLALIPELALALGTMAELG